MVLPDNAKRAQKTPAPRSVVSGELLTAYPNPTTGPVYLVYKVPEGVEQVELRMLDALGRLVTQERVAPRNGIIEVLPSQLATGMHVAALYCDGIRVGTAKVNVLR